MKKVLIAVLLFAGLAAFAQEQNPGTNRQGKEKFSAQQRNELMLKKMTLELGLNESQQKDMSKIIADGSAKRDAAMAERKANKDEGVKPTSDERYQMESKRLDDEIVVKDKVRKILTPDQFKKWEQMKADRKGKMHNHKQRREMENQNQNNGQ